MKKLFAAVAVASVVLLGGCAKIQNQIARNGSFIGSTNGDWIVVKYSGGKITDVWKLTNSLVQSEEHSDGWLFQDNDGNPVNVGGDSVHWRINNTKDMNSLWNRFHEYHYSLEGGEYIPSPKAQ